jgi:hypothetical protein
MLLLLILLEREYCTALKSRFEDYKERKTLRGLTDPASAATHGCRTLVCQGVVAVRQRRGVRGAAAKEEKGGDHDGSRGGG